MGQALSPDTSGTDEAHRRNVARQGIMTGLNNMFGSGRRPWNRGDAPRPEIFGDKRADMQAEIDRTNAYRDTQREARGELSALQDYDQVKQRLQDQLRRYFRGHEAEQEIGIETEQTLQRSRDSLNAYIESGDLEEQARRLRQRVENGEDLNYEEAKKLEVFEAHIQHRIDLERGVERRNERLDILNTAAAEKEAFVQSNGPLTDLQRDQLRRHSSLDSRQQQQDMLNNLREFGIPAQALQRAQDRLDQGLDAREEVRVLGDLWIGDEAPAALLANAKAQNARENAFADVVRSNEANWAGWQAAGRQLSESMNERDWRNAWERFYNLEKPKQRALANLNRELARVVGETEANALISRAQFLLDERARTDDPQMKAYIDSQIGVGIISELMSALRDINIPNPLEAARNALPWSEQNRERRAERRADRAASRAERRGR